MWKSVLAEVPDECEDVLVSGYVNLEEYEWCVDVAYYFLGKWFDREGKEITNVDYWMEIPEPPIPKRAKEDK